MNLSPQTVGLIRAGIAVLAALFQSGVIPTGVDGGGDKVAAALVALAFALPAGDKTTLATMSAAEKEGLK